LNFIDWWANVGNKNRQLDPHFTTFTPSYSGITNIIKCSNFCFFFFWIIFSICRISTKKKSSIFLPPFVKINWAQLF
jgi:hypothetical protein